MISRLKNEDPIVDFLSRRCVLTEAQMDTMVLSQMKADLGVKASRREKGKVTKGAFVRTLRQGRANIESAIYSLILFEYLGLVAPDTSAQLSRALGLFSKVKEGRPSASDSTRLLKALEDFVAHYSGRRRKTVIL